jgi:hypothetical protein
MRNSLPSSKQFLKLPVGKSTLGKDRASRAEIALPILRDLPTSTNNDEPNLRLEHAGISQSQNRADSQDMTQTGTPDECRQAQSSK